MPDTIHDNLLAEAAEHLLSGQCTPATVRALEAGATPATLWQAIEDSGFCDALLSEAQGGAGLGLRDVQALLEACGRHALPLSLAQTLAARALLAEAGHTAAPGAIALATATLRADRPITVHTGAVADRVLVADAGTLVLLDAHTARRERLSGSTDAQLSWSAAALDSPLFTLHSSVDLRAIEAALLAAQMAGALRQVFDRTLQYANDRSQFGRSIGKFQAIQHQLSVMAEHTAAATMAARLAHATGATVVDPLLAAVAKARCSEAVVPVVAIAHAMHGAIGITADFDLQLLTRRLQTWRLTAGSESHWHERIGRALLASGQGLPDYVQDHLSARAAA